MTKNEEIVTSVVCEGCEMLSKDCFKSCSAFCSALKVANFKDEQLNQLQDERKTIKFWVNGEIKYGDLRRPAQLLISFSNEPTVEEILEDVADEWGDYQDYLIESITRI
jgi:hypothetical protein